MIDPKIIDLAKDLIRLSGLRPDEDIEIKFSGTRPGEKLFEELSTTDEKADKTTHLKIFVGQVKEVPLPEMNSAFLGLESCLASPEPQKIYDSLQALIPEFTGEYRGQ